MLQQEFFQVAWFRQQFSIFNKNYICWWNTWHIWYVQISLLPFQKYLRLPKYLIVYQWMCKMLSKGPPIELKSDMFCEVLQGGESYGISSRYPCRSLRSATSVFPASLLCSPQNHWWSGNQKEWQQGRRRENRSRRRRENRSRRKQRQRNTSMRGGR